MISIVDKRPELASEWDAANGVPQEQVSYGSNKRYKWIGKCGHCYEASPKSRSLGQGCPYCSGKRVLVGFNDLKSQYPLIAAEWSPENPIGPDAITTGSSKKYAWVCAACGYKWDASVKNRTHGCGCPKCAGNFVVKGDNDLATVHPELAIDWSPKNGTLKPSDVMPFSNGKAWWICHVCGYEWESFISSRSKGSGCPCCQGMVLVPGINDLLTKNPKIAMEWSEDNMGLKPSDFSERSHKLVMWTCSKCGHDWCASIYSRCFGKDKGCSFCAKERSKEKYAARLEERRQERSRESNRLEIAVQEFATEHNLQMECNTDTLIGIPVDYYFPELNTVLILPKISHNSYHGRRVQSVINDLLKKKGIRVVRILEPGMEKFKGCECVVDKGGDLRRQLNRVMIKAKKTD